MVDTNTKTNDLGLDGTSTADSSAIQARYSRQLIVARVVVAIIVIILGLCLGLWPCDVGFSGRGVGNCEDIDECTERAFSFLD